MCAFRQITKQLNKLVEVVKVVDLSEGAHIERELMLIKVKALDLQSVQRSMFQCCSRAVRINPLNEKARLIRFLRVQR